MPIKIFCPHCGNTEQFYHAVSFTQDVNSRGEAISKLYEEQRTSPYFCEECCEICDVVEEEAE